MGRKAPFFRQYREPWAACSNCGFDVPRSKMRLHRRFGWVCTGYPGANCWDGGPQKDEIFYTPRPYEGTRRTAAPITGNFHAGWTDGDFVDPSIYGGIPPSPGKNPPPSGGGFGPVILYLFDQAVPANSYRFTFGSPTIVYQLQPGSPLAGGLDIGGGYTFYVETGLVKYKLGTVPHQVASPPALAGHLNVVGGMLIYIPVT